MPDKGAWFDIIPPEAPAASGGMGLTGLLLVALVLLLAVLALWGYMRYVRGDRRALKQLAVHLEKGRLEPREACCRIRRVLRRSQYAAGLHNISSHPQHQTGWQQFQVQLLQGCFSRKPPAAADVQALLLQAMDWLKEMEPH